MKKFYCLGVLFLMVLPMKAQEVCDAFLLLKEGTHLEYTDYDRKGKEYSRSSHTTQSISKEGSKVIAEIAVEAMDLKKKENVYSNTYEISCENNVLSFDMMRFFDNSKLSQFGEGNFDVQIEGDALDFPSSAGEGDILNNGNITVTIETGGVTFMTMTMNITNRKVESGGSITTPAGTFDCKKISYDFDTKAGIVKTRGSAEQWFNDEQIMVQSITYNKKGKELGKSVLTKLEN